MKFQNLLLCSVLSLALAPLMSQAAPGDLCRAVTSRPLNTEAVKAALADGESANTLCGMISATAYAMLEANTNSQAALFLISQGADPNFVNYEHASGHPRYTSNLAWAAEWSNVEVIRAFLARSPDLEFAPKGRTALAFALNSRHWDIADALLDAGAYLPRHPGPSSTGKGVSF